MDLAGRIPCVLGYGHTHSVTIPMALRHSLSQSGPHDPHLSYRVVWEVLGVDDQGRCWVWWAGLLGSPGNGGKGTLPRMWILEAKRVLRAKVPLRAGGPCPDLGLSLS